MAVNLIDLVPTLRRQTNQPSDELNRSLGTELFTDQTDGILVGYLSDAFWEGKLYGFYGGYTEDDGVVTPESGSTDLDRTWQQLIVFYAAMKILENEYLNRQSLFRAVAGPVEYEVQYSAQLLRDHLATLQKRLEHLLDTLDSTYSSSFAYIDMICARTGSMIHGINHFESGWGVGDYGRY